MAAVDADVERLSVLPGLTDDPSVVGLLQVKEQQVPITTKTVHRRHCCTGGDSLLPIHKLF